MANLGREHWNTIKRILDTSRVPQIPHYVMEDQNLLSEVRLIQILLMTLRKENLLQAICSQLQEEL